MANGQEKEQQQDTTAGGPSITGGIGASLEATEEERKEKQERQSASEEADRAFQELQQAKSRRLHPKDVTSEIVDVAYEQLQRSIRRKERLAAEGPIDKIVRVATDAVETTGRILNNLAAGANLAPGPLQGKLPMFNMDVPDPEELSLLEVNGATAVAGLAEGTKLVFENVPFVGDKLIQPYLDPSVRELNQGAMRLTTDFILENFGKFGDVPPDDVMRSVQASKILGTLAGVTQAFVPLFGALRAPFTAAGANVFMAELGAGFAYGALTNEPGLLSPEGLLNRGRERTQPETHRDRSEELWSRLVSGVTIAGEFAGFLAILRGVSFFAMTQRNINKWRASVQTRTPTQRLLAEKGPAGITGKDITKARLDVLGEAVRTGKPTTALETFEAIARGGEGGIISPTGRQFSASVKTAEVAAARANTESITELVTHHPEGLRTLMEGGTDVEAAVSVIRSAPEGEIGVIQGLSDPAQVLGGIRRELQTQAQRARTLEELEFVKRNTTLLSHRPAELQRVIEGNREVPTFLAWNRAQEAGAGSIFTGDLRVAAQGGAETIVRPSSREAIFRAKTWEEVFAADKAARGVKGGSPRGIDKITKQFRDDGIEVIVVEEGSGGFREVVPLRGEVIRSTRRVDPVENAAQKVVADSRGLRPSIAARPGEVGGFETELLAKRLVPDEPIEVALKKRFDNLTFQRVRGPNGEMNLMFWDSSVQVPNKIIKQFKEVGFFSGQKVRWRGGTFKFERPSPDAPGEFILIKDLHGRQVRRVKKSEVRAMFHGEELGFQGVEEAVADKFARFIDKETRRAADNAMMQEDIRAAAKALSDPATAERDILLEGHSYVTHPHHVPGVTGPSLEERELLRRLLREDDPSIFVNHPSPPPNEADMLFNRFLESEGLMGELTPGQRNALKHTVFARTRERLYNRLPKRDRQAFEDAVRQYERTSQDLPLRQRAAQQGWKLVADHPTGGVQLKQLNGRRVEHFADEETALAFLDNIKPMQRELLPGAEPFAVSNPVPWGPMGHPTPEGDTGIFYLTKNLDDIKRLYDEQQLTQGITQNMIAWARDLDEGLDTPFFTRIVDDIVQGQKRKNTAMDPFQADLNGVFGGFKQEQRFEIGRFMRNMEGKPEALNDKELFARALKDGLSKKQANAVVGYRQIMNRLFEIGQKQFGWKIDKDYVFNYFSRIKPQIEKDIPADQIYGGKLPTEIDSFWAKYQRKGMLPVMEEDPFLVAKKYINAFFWEQEMKQPWGRAMDILDLKVGDLPESLRKQLVETFVAAGKRSSIKPNHPVFIDLNPAGRVQTNKALIPEFGAIMGEFMTRVQSFERATLETGTGMVQSIGKAFGVNIPRQIAEEYISIMQGIWYGAALGARPIPIIRNYFQNLWNLYPRIGGRAINKGLEAALKPEKFEEARKAGAFTLKEFGVPFGRALFERKKFETPIKAAQSAPLRGFFFAPLAKLGLNFGSSLKGISQRALAPFGASDIFNRVWAFHAQKEFITPFVRRWEAGKINTKKLLDEGLEFWGKADKAEFRRLVEKDPDRAIDFLSVRAADITNYVYGLSAQPLKLQRSAGRLLGTFGTWPAWQYELVKMNWKTADALGKMKLATRYATMVAGVGAVANAFRVDLWNWMAPAVPFTYGGGPGMDMAKDLSNLFGEGWSHKAAAASKLITNGLRLGFPGQLMFRDISRSLQQLYDRGDPRAAMTALFLGRPIQDGSALPVLQMDPDRVEHRDGEPKFIPGTPPASPLDAISPPQQGVGTPQAQPLQLEDISPPQRQRLPLEQTEFDARQTQGGAQPTTQPKPQDLR